MDLVGIQFSALPDVDAPISCEAHIGIRVGWNASVMPISNHCPQVVMDLLDASVASWTVKRAQKVTKNDFLTIPVELTLHPAADAQPGRLELLIAPYYVLGALPEEFKVEPSVYLVKGKWPRFRDNEVFSTARICEIEARVTTTGEVADLVVGRCDSAYHETVQKAVGRWVFSPLLIDGQPSEWSLSLVVPFDE